MWANLFIYISCASSNLFLLLLSALGDSSTVFIFFALLLGDSFRLAASDERLDPLIDKHFIIIILVQNEVKLCLPFYPQLD